MNTHPLVARALATEKTVAKFSGQPVEWGLSDCVSIGISHMKNMGLKPPPLANSVWGSEKQALRALSNASRKAGLARPSLAELLNSCGLLEINPLEALVGDFLGAPADQPWDIALGVCAGAQQMLASVSLADGSWRVVVGTADVANRAWRLNPCLP